MKVYMGFGNATVDLRCGLVVERADFHAEGAVFESPNRRHASALKSSAAGV
jgi:hypothetical protein